MKKKILKSLMFFVFPIVTFLLIGTFLFSSLANGFVFAVSGNGGGLFVAGNSSMFFSDGTTVSGNLATNGGGIYVQSGGELVLGDYSIEEGDVVEFGSYPQSLATNISSTTSLSYDYVTGFYSDKKGNRYARVVANPNNSSSKFDNGETIESGTVYFFNVEPLKWKVLSVDKTKGTASLVALNIIDCRDFYGSREARTINSQEILANNYKYSDVRAWLNGYGKEDGNTAGENWSEKGFLQLAFTGAEQALIKKNDVENDASTTNSTSNSYVCEDTKDKIYLLSYKESATLETADRQKQTTDFARAKHAFELIATHKGYWFTRSPYQSTSITYCVSVVNGSGGLTSDSVNADNDGIVPAMTVSLSGLVDLTISGNTAGENGGGVYVENGGNVTLNGGKIFGNSAKSGNDIYNAGTLNVTGGIIGTAGVGNVVEFGSYPQSLATNVGSVTYNSDDGYYYDRKGNKYVEIEADPYGGSFSDGTEIEKREYYLFKVEPLRWRVLKVEGGNATLFCENIIDCINFYNNTSNRTINGKTIYPNNYEHSTIRAWLNGIGDYENKTIENTYYENLPFLQKAFTSEEQSWILTTTVDNSASTTDTTGNTYACENTEDKIFLLSFQELLNINYGFEPVNNREDENRKKYTSDYARALHASFDADGNGNWWTRSPIGGSGFEECANYVYEDGKVIGGYWIEQTDDGKLLESVNLAIIGVVPALTVPISVFIQDEGIGVVNSETGEMNVSDGSIFDLVENHGELNISGGIFGGTKAIENFGTLVINGGNITGNISTTTDFSMRIEANVTGEISLKNSSILKIVNYTGTTPNLTINIDASRPNGIILTLTGSSLSPNLKNISFVGQGGETGTFKAVQGSSSDVWNVFYISNLSESSGPAIEFEEEDSSGNTQNFVVFGEYPKSAKTADVTVDESIKDSRGYYFGSDNAWYAKVNSSYFKVEPIKWRVLKEENSVLTLLAEDIIDYFQFNYSSYESTNPNTYENSYLDNWFSETFYDVAFSSEEQELIAETALSTSLTRKIFALSSSEATSSSFGFNTSSSTADSNRVKTGTDFSIAKGASATYSWWLRTAGIYKSSSGSLVQTAINPGTLNSTDYTYVVLKTGVLSIIQALSNSGVVPALRMTLEKQDNCTVLFKSDGVVVEERVVGYGNPIGTLPTTTKTGYELCGWSPIYEATYDDLDTCIKSTFIVTQNQTFEAIWKEKVIKVTLAPGDDVDTVGTSVFYFEYGTNKYYSSKACSSQILSITCPEKRGYIFLGYYNGETCYISSTGTFTNNLYISFGSDVTLSAKWSAINYQITISEDEGRVNNKIYNIGKIDQTRTIFYVIKNGYTHNGWTISWTDDDEHAEDSLLPTVNGTNLTIPANCYGNVTLKSKGYYANSYTIKLNANGGTISNLLVSSGSSGLSIVTDNSKLMATYGETGIFTASVKRTGYTFNGWSNSGSGTVEINSSSLPNFPITSVKNLTTAAGGTVTLTAQWKADTYNIKVLDENGTELIDKKQTYDYSDFSLQTKTFSSLTQTGHTFKGWSVSWTDSTHSSTLPTISGTSLEIQACCYGNLTLKSQGFKANTYMINLKYDETNERCPYDTVYVQYGTSKLQSSRSGASVSDDISGLQVTPAATKKNDSSSEFLGWFTEKNGGLIVISGGYLVENVDDYTDENGNWTRAQEGVNLYARFETKKFVVTCDMNGGTFLGGSGWNSSDDKTTASKEFAYGSAIGSFPSVSKKGYTLIGWFGTRTAGAESTINTNVYENFTLYAHWKINTYIITLNATTNSGTCSYEKVYLAYMGKTFYSSMSGDKYPYDLSGEENVKPIAKKNGSGFLGWFTSASGGNQIIDEEGNLNANKTGWTDANGNWIKTSDVELYAQFEEQTYTLTLNANGGTFSEKSGWNLNEGNTIATKTLKYGESVGTFPVSTYNNGYEKSGWFTSASGGTMIVTTNYVWSDYVSSGKWNCERDVNLYAQWKSKTICISFDFDWLTANDVENNETCTSEVYYKFGTNKYYSDENCTVVISKIECPKVYGYTFGGYKKADGYSDYTGGTKDSFYINEEGKFINDLYNTIYESSTLKISLEANKYTIDIIEGDVTIQKTYKVSQSEQTIDNITTDPANGYAFTSWEVAWSGSDHANDSLLPTAEGKKLTIPANCYGGLQLKSEGKKAIEYEINIVNGDGDIDVLFANSESDVMSYTISSSDQTFYFKALEGHSIVVSKIVWNESNGNRHYGVCEVTTDENGTGIIVKADSFGDITITADYKINKYTVTIYMYGGKCSGDGYKNVEEFVDNKNGWSNEKLDGDIFGKAPILMKEFNYGDTFEFTELPENVEKNGYDFQNWIYDGSSFTSTSSLVVTKDILIYANLVAKTIKITLDPNGGKISGVLNNGYFYYKFDKNEYKEVDGSVINKFSIPSWAGHAFLGYNTQSDGEGVYYIDAQGNPYYTFTDKEGEKTNTLYNTIGEDTTLYAIWEAETYSIELDPNGGSFNVTNNSLTIDGVTWTLNSSGYLTRTGVEYGTKVGDLNLPAPQVRTGYTFKGWFTSKEDDATQITDDFVINQGYNFVAWWEKGEYIYFGEYPQTVLADTSIITTNQDSDGYYLGTDGNRYAKVEANIYDPINDHTFTDGKQISNGDPYYFKVEPIKWRILESDNGTVLLLCENAIFGMLWDDSNNNYVDSEIRAYLNGYSTTYGSSYLNNGFLQKAFTETERNYILTTEVDNSASTTADSSSNQYACDNTSDKVFLLSYKDLINSVWFESNVTRVKLVTDYAIANGVEYYTGVTFVTPYSTDWWSRSPMSDWEFDVSGVTCAGKLDNFNVKGLTFDHYKLGVVPALNISTDCFYDFYCSKCGCSGYTTSVEKITYTLTDSGSHTKTITFICPDCCNETSYSTTEYHTMTLAYHSSVLGHISGQKCVYCSYAYYDGELESHSWLSSTTQVGKRYCSICKYLTDDDEFSQIVMFTSNQSLTGDCSLVSSDEVLFDEKKEDSEETIFLDDKRTFKTSYEPKLFEI